MEATKIIEWIIAVKISSHIYLLKFIFLIWIVSLMGCLTIKEATVTHKWITRSERIITNNEELKIIVIEDIYHIEVIGYNERGRFVKKNIETDYLNYKELKPGMKVKIVDGKIYR